MKKIKVKILYYNKNILHGEKHFILDILEKYYELEFSDTPDYIFYNESSSDYLKYDCIRIFYTGENVSPNFNLCDYATSFDYLDFEDRHYRLPLYLITVFYNPDELKKVGEDYLSKQTVFTKEDLLKKTEFCSFVYSNYLANEEREIFFNKLNTYKKINSGGKYLNNVGGPVKNKLEFEMNHKFSIAFENSSRSGYTTEKLVGPLVANTIPIYFGNPKIGKEFNTRRFINCHEYKSFDDVIEKVKELDNNDELYLQMINESFTIPEYNFEEIKRGFDTFLRNIIDQPVEHARRRTINRAIAATLEKNELFIINQAKKQGSLKYLLSIIYKPFKKIKYLETLKHKYFRNKYLKK